MSKENQEKVVKMLETSKGFIFINYADAGIDFLVDEISELSLIGILELYKHRLIAGQLQYHPIKDVASTYQKGIQ